MKVDFMIIGAQKSGTTSLSEQLASHCQISFCKMKEPAFFNRVTDWQEKLPEYHDLYSPADGRRYGEASTSYTFLPEYPDTHSRLYEYNPDLKLIYMMRNPVERIVSHYAHRVMHHRVTQPPEDVVFSDAAYVNRSRYAFQVHPYRKLFGNARVLLLIFEEYIARPRYTLMEIADFLQISRSGFEKTDIQPKNKSPQKTQFPKPVKDRLWQLLEEDVREMEQILGRRLDVWRISL